MTAAEEQRLAESARPLWDALEELGWVDGWGGTEFERVFPATLDFIRAQANESPWCRFDFVDGKVVRIERLQGGRH